ncbi:MAG: hypothetical protein R3F38_18935 [Gammaproteobacteria bacterium]
MPQHIKTGGIDFAAQLQAYRDVGLLCLQVTEQLQQVGQGQAFAAIVHGSRRRQIIAQPQCSAFEGADESGRNGIGASHTGSVSKWIIVMSTQRKFIARTYRFWPVFEQTDRD